MIHILLVSSNTNVIDNVTALLKNHNNIEISKSEFGMDALKKVTKEKYQLVLIDEIVNDMSGFKLAENLVASDPFLNCAMISGLPPKEFHEASEGLGILMQLPLFPTETHIENLLSHLQKICSLTPDRGGDHK